MQRLWGGNASALSTAADLLRRGELVAIPTETVYGLAAHACNESAVRSIFTVKGRPLIDPLIVHFASLDQISEECEISPTTQKLTDAFWPGPLTLVLPRKSGGSIPQLVSAGKSSLAVRVPGHPLFRQLLKDSRLPLAAPSANPFGYISPTRPEHVEASLNAGVAAVLDGGQCEHGVESTIIEVCDDQSVRLLRPGPIAIEEVLRLPGIREASARQEDESLPVAPGMLKSHYRPAKGIELFPLGKPPKSITARDAIVHLMRPSIAPENHFWLSESGNHSEIAHNLFHLLRQLDTTQTFDRVYVETPEVSSGIIRAVRDRLERAATPPD